MTVRYWLHWRAALQGRLARELHGGAEPGKECELGYFERGAGQHCAQRFCDRVGRQKANAIRMGEWKAGQLRALQRLRRLIDFLRWNDYRFSPAT